MGQDENSPEANRQNPPRRDDMEIIRPALRVGGLLGVSGVVVGGFAGILRSTTPMLFALASGIQWFTLSTTFMASRGVVLRTSGTERATPRDKVFASAIAGGVGGMAGGIVRGPRNMLPGAVMFALFGATGQYLYNRADAQNTQLAESGEPLKKYSLLNSKWSPARVMTDAEYAELISEKLKSIDAHIAMVDEQIEALEAQERELVTKTNSESSASKSF